MAARSSFRSRLRRPVERFRRGGREALLWTARLTAAAVASYVVAIALLPGGRPLLAPLTALLVIQATPVGLLRSGLDRVASVVVGVLLAVAVAEVVPLTWWSLGIVIAVSLLVGQALRLRSNLLEAPISAMLVLGVVQTDVAAWKRVAETLVGAGVGVITNLLLPPKVPYAGAAEAIDGLTGTLSGLLHRAADEVADSRGEGEQVAAAATEWLGEARRITHDIPHVSAAVERVEEGRKLNMRAVRELDSTPGLRQGLEALEHTAVSLRGLFRTIQDATHDEAWPEDEAAAQASADLQQVLDALGDAVTAFGGLVSTEAMAVDLQAPERAAVVAEALEAMNAARSMLSRRNKTSNAALAELYLHLSAALKRVRTELDLDGRTRRQHAFRPARRPVRDVITPRRPRPPRDR
jgi:hypothetical protein